MGNIRLLASSLFALTTLVACGDDGGATMIVDSGIVDAPPVDQAPPIDQPPAVNYDLSCATNTTPPAASQMITVAGTVNEVTMNGLSPLMGAVVKACRGNCTNTDLLATATPNPTDSTGNFTTGQIATGGTALDGYLLIEKNTHWPTRIYPFAALTEDLTGAPTAMITQATVNALEQFGLITQDAGNGMVAIIVTDCAATPTGVGGATVSVTVGGNAVGDDVFDISAFDPSFAGVYFVANVPPGDVVVKAAVSGTNFLDNTASVVADGLTGVQMRPGY